MKLISKTILYYLLVILPLLAGTGYYAFTVISEEVRDGTDEGLYREKLNMENLVKALNIEKSLYLRPDSLTAITVLPTETKIDAFSDTVVYDKLEEGDLGYRVYRSYFFNNGKHYVLTCSKPALETEELKESLQFTFFIVLGVLVISFFAVSLILSRVLWKPFYKTIELLDQYDINSQKELHFDKVSVKEFRQLNKAIEKMTARLARDYAKQKEFTENASHELQTPLAILKTKLDLLIQSKKLGQEELELLQGMEKAVQKISSLNKALLLLTKIENKQFKEQKEIQLRQVTESALENYSGLYADKKIKVETRYNGSAQIMMNPVLADLMISNLLQNAFRHNLEGGTILIELDEKNLKISNSGEPLRVNADDLFTRFKKNDASKESLGLGLSIVNGIVSTYGFTINYAYNGGLHSFNIAFKH